LQRRQALSLVYELPNFHPSFEGFCWSAMCEKVQDGIFRGRPFGGLGVLITKSLGLRACEL